MTNSRDKTRSPAFYDEEEELYAHSYVSSSSDDSNDVEVNEEETKTITMKNEDGGKGTKEEEDVESSHFFSSPPSTQPIELSPHSRKNNLTKSKYSFSDQKKKRRPPRQPHWPRPQIAVCQKQIQRTVDYMEYRKFLRSLRGQYGRTKRKHIVLTFLLLCFMFGVFHLKVCKSSISVTIASPMWMTSNFWGIALWSLWTAFLLAVIMIFAQLLATLPLRWCLNVSYLFFAMYIVLVALQARARNFYCTCGTNYFFDSPSASTILEKENNSTMTATSRWLKFLNNLDPLKVDKAIITTVFVYCILQIFLVGLTLFATFVFPIIVREGYWPLRGWKVMSATPLIINVPFVQNHRLHTKAENWSEIRDNESENNRRHYQLKTFGWFVHVRYRHFVGRLWNLLCCVPMSSSKHKRRFKARIYGHGCYYQGEVDAEGRPHGFGKWKEERYHGEILVGYWKDGRPVGPFKSREFGSGSGFLCSRICYAEYRVGQAKGKCSEKLRLNWGVGSVECSVSGAFFRGYPRVTMNPAPSPLTNSEVCISQYHPPRSYYNENNPSSLRIPEDERNHLSSAWSAVTSRFTSLFHSPPTSESSSEDSATQPLMNDGRHCSRRAGKAEDVELAEAKTFRKSPRWCFKELGRRGHFPNFTPIPQTMLSVGVDRRGGVFVNGLMCKGSYLLGERRRRRSTAILTSPDKALEDPKNKESPSSVTIRVTMTSEAKKDQNLKNSDPLSSSAFSSIGTPTFEAVEGFGDSCPAELPLSCDPHLSALPPNASPSSRSLTSVPAIEQILTDTPQLVADGWISLESAGAAEALVFIHGYNCALFYSLGNFGQLMAMSALPPYIKPFAFCWPGGTNPFSFFAAHNVAQSAETAQAFVKFIASLGHLGFRQFHFIGHSMGNRVMIHGLRLAFKKGLFEPCAEEHAQKISKQKSRNILLDRGAPQSRSRLQGLLKCCTVTSLNPEYFLDEFIEKDFNLMRQHCSVISIYGDTNDKALWWSELFLRKRSLGRAVFGLRRDGTWSHGVSAPHHFVVQITATQDLPPGLLPPDPTQMPSADAGCPFFNGVLEEEKLLSRQNFCRRYSSDSADDARRIKGLPSNKLRVDNTIEDCSVANIRRWTLLPSNSIPDVQPPKNWKLKVKQLNPKNLVPKEDFSTPPRTAPPSSAPLHPTDRSAPSRRKSSSPEVTPPQWLDLDVIDTTFVDQNVHAIRHSFYNVNREIIEDLREIVSTRRRAWQRSSRLDRREGNVWVFRAAPSHLGTLYD